MRTNRDSPLLSTAALVCAGAVVSAITTGLCLGIAWDFPHLPEEAAREVRTLTLLPLIPLIVVFIAELSFRIGSKDPTAGELEHLLDLKRHDRWLATHRELSGWSPGVSYYLRRSASMPQGTTNDMLEHLVEWKRHQSWRG